MLDCLKRGDTFCFEDGVVLIVLNDGEDSGAGMEAQCMWYNKNKINFMYATAKIGASGLNPEKAISVSRTRKKDDGGGETTNGLVHRVQAGDVFNLWEPIPTPAPPSP